MPTADRVEEMTQKETILSRTDTKYFQIFHTIKAGCFRLVTIIIWLEYSDQPVGELADDTGDIDPRGSANQQSAIFHPLIRRLLVSVDW